MSVQWEDWMEERAMSYAEDGEEDSVVPRETVLPSSAAASPAKQEGDADGNCSSLHPPLAAPPTLAQAMARFGLALERLRRLL